MAERDNVAGTDAVGYVCDGEFGVWSRIWFTRLTQVGRGSLIIAAVVVILVAAAPEVEHRHRFDVILEHSPHPFRHDHVRQRGSADKDKREERVVCMAVRDEDVSGPRCVDAQARVEHEIELGDQEGCVPRRAGFASENEMRKGLGKRPFQNRGARRLREGRRKGWHYVGEFRATGIM